MPIDAIQVQLTKLELKAGDTLAVMMNQAMNGEQLHACSEHVRRFVPEGVKVLVLGQGVSLIKITADCDRDAGRL